MEANHGIFIIADKTMIIAIYVNDILLFNTNIDPRINDIMQNFWDRF